jgi:hypothetical protein
MNPSRRPRRRRTPRRLAGGVQLRSRPEDPGHVADHDRRLARRRDRDRQATADEAEQDGEQLIERHRPPSCPTSATRRRRSSRRLAYAATTGQFEARDLRSRACSNLSGGSAGPDLNRTVDEGVCPAQKTTGRRCVPRGARRRRRCDRRFRSEADAPEGGRAARGAERGCWRSGLRTSAFRGPLDARVRGAVRPP